MAETPLTYGEVNDVVLEPTRPGRTAYFALMGFLATGIAWGAFSWIYQIRTGMGITGYNTPVNWAVYITNFVFWIGIGHAGTLISAILFLVRSKWRVAVSRAAEAMTVFAVMTAGLFPLIHLGRFWVFYFIIPYPSQRQIWPNFTSPLVWDVCAVTTYLTVSTIFWFIGLVPDLASARDYWAQRAPDSWRARLYRTLSLGWDGSGSQWRHFGRAYLFFAALATPLVISVHSVVSWDFAMSNLPGWHSTIFAPYFVAGAIHGGLAMVLTLMIPMRRILKLHKVVRMEHFEAVAEMMIPTGLIVGYAYLVESFISWYSGDLFERQFTVWRATGWIAVLFWSLPLLNALVPMAFLFRRVRRSVLGLLLVAMAVNVGMWNERFVIIVGSLAHDFLPHNWTTYAPRWPEYSISFGSLCLFMFGFLLFVKYFPTVSISDVKEVETEGEERYYELDTDRTPATSARDAAAGVLAVFADRKPMLEMLNRARRNGFEQLETYSPVRVREAEQILGRGPSPVRYWTLTGAVMGCAGGFALAIGSALVNNLTVGAKPVVALIPFCIVGFEGTILCGVLANLAGVIYYCRLARKLALPREYDLRFMRDRYGVYVACGEGQAQTVRALISDLNPDEVRLITPAVPEKSL